MQSSDSSSIPAASKLATRVDFPAPVSATNITTPCGVRTALAFATNCSTRCFRGCSNTSGT